MIHLHTSWQGSRYFDNSEPSQSPDEEARATDANYVPLASEPHLAAIYLSVANQGINRASAQREIHESASHMRRAREAARDAHEKAREAKEKSSFWQDVAGVAGTIGTIAAAASTIAVTGGAGAVLVGAGVAAKVGGKVAKEAGVIGEGTAGWIDIAGSAAMAGGSFMPAAAAPNALAAAVETGGQVVNLGASASEAGATFADQQYQAVSIHHQASAESHNTALVSAESNRDTGIDNLRKTVQGARKEAEIVMQITDAEHESKRAIISNMRG